MKQFFKRIRSQKGMSGVLVALLLVIVGVGLVAGVQTYMSKASTNIQTAGNTAINKATTAAANAGTAAP
jgi:Tfp pilus assembly protein PilV